jgi:manganese/zinc/iron transport system substrate-binding protein
MIGDLVADIGGDHVVSKVLIQGFSDPHSYELVKGDGEKIQQAKIIFTNGLGLEHGGSLQGALKKHANVVVLGDVINKNDLIIEEGVIDPHVWMDPSRWRHAIEAVRSALIESLPEEAPRLRQRAQAHLEEIAAVDGYAKSILGTVPIEARVVITAHDAFRYFGAAYGFEVLGVQGISTESEAGLAHIRTLVETIVTRRIRAIFVESSVSDRNLRALKEGAGAQGFEVEIGGELFSDSLGPAGSYEGTYLGMIDHNATTIARGLGGSAPARGFSGRLMARG